VKRTRMLATLLIFMLILPFLFSNLKLQKTTSVSMLLSPNIESMKVHEIISKSTNSSFLGGNNVFIFSLKNKYNSLDKRYEKEIHQSIHRVGLNVTLDYFLLKSDIQNKVTKDMEKYINKYYQYISYLKSLVNQLDAVSFYVIGALEDAWKLKMFLLSLPKLETSIYERSLILEQKANKFEHGFQVNEEKLTERIYVARLHVKNLMYKISRAYDLFVNANKALTRLYNLFLKALEIQCKTNGTISFKEVSKYLNLHVNGTASIMAPVFSNAILDTALAWPGNLTNICKDPNDFRSFALQSLARFISLAPKEFSKVMSQKYNVTNNQARTLLTLALSIGPGIERKVMESALSEALRILFDLSSTDAVNFLKAISGDRKAYAYLVIEFAHVNDPCFMKASLDSILTNTSLSITLRRCEYLGLLNVFNKYSPRPYDPDLINITMASGGLHKEHLNYLRFYVFYQKLLQRAIRPSLAYKIASTGKVENLTQVIYSYLSDKGVLYADAISKAVVHSKDFEQARRQALMLVFGTFTKEMITGGLSTESVNTLLNYLLAWSPGLTPSQIDEIVYRIVLTEFENRARDDPSLLLLKKLVDTNKFLKGLVYCNDTRCALSITKIYANNVVNKFLHNYVALDLLVGNDGKHLIVIVNGKLNHTKVRKLETLLNSSNVISRIYATGKSLLNQDVQKSITESLETINKVATLFVLIALLLSTKSIKLSIIPVIIIYIVLQYYKVLVFLISNILNVRPSTIDLIVATATILGMGIDYSLYAASRYTKERSLKEALKPVLVASSMASTGFLIFGVLSFFLLPSLATLGLFIPLAIMFTATMGPLLTFTIVSILNIKEKDKVYRLPLLVAVSRDSPKLVISLALVLALASLYVLMIAPPGYDLFLFLPSNAPSVKGLHVLQKYSSPGVVGPTIVLLKLKDNACLGNATYQLESLVQYFLQSGYFDYAFTYTRPLGKFISNDPTILNILGGRNYLQNGYIKLYLLPHYPPDSNIMIEYVKHMREFLRNWIKKRGTIFSSVLVGGESAMNYDLSRVTNNIIQNYILPSMILIMSIVLALIFKRKEFIVASILAIVVSMSLALGMSDVVFRGLFHVPLLWLVVPLLVTTILSVGSDYLVFYLFGVKETIEECKITIDGECLDLLGALSYASAKLSNLIMGFATTFAVAYFALMVSDIWALREIGLALGSSAILLLLAIGYSLVPAILALVYRRR